MDKIAPYFPLILQGFAYTVGIAVAAIVLSQILGLILGLLRMSPHRLISTPTAAFVEVARGTSEVVQMYWIYFALPVLLLIQLPPVVAGILVLGVNQGAYISEIVRGAFSALPRAQVEGTIALNFNSRTRFRRVLFPQALAIMLPALGNSAVDVTKATSVVSLITVTDLTFRVQQVRSLTGESALSFGIALVLYLILTSAITFLVGRIEKRLPAGLQTSIGMGR